MATEHERIERIRSLLQRPSPVVEVGIGDDCAVLSEARGPRVWTIDSAVEGVHFRRDRMSLDAIAYRSFMAAASDIAAMGARATAALSALTLPSGLSDNELDALLAGLARAADECACPIVGGNLSRGSELSLTATVLGEPHGKALLRSGARAGDGLFVTGCLGSAAVGMQALFAQRSEPEHQRYISAFLAPRARFDVAQALAAVASSAIDISDGLLQDAGHLCRASLRNAQIEIERIPRLSDFAGCVTALALDPLSTLVAGGEDYEILFTAAEDADLGTWATRIGVIHAGTGEVVLRDADGRRCDATRAGFDHFR